MSSLNKKKGLSPIISYILLISFILIISTIVFQWIRTYIPQEPLQCDEGVSVFVSDVSGYVCGTNDDEFDLAVKNNGRFSIAGYFIRGSNEAGQLATIDLSAYSTKGNNGRVEFVNGENSMAPDSERTVNFDWTGVDLGELYSLEIIPARYEEKDNRLRISQCGDARIVELLCEAEEVTSCTDDSDCTGSKPYCETVSEVCVECLDDAHCDAGAGETCESNSCVSYCGNNLVGPDEECDGTTGCIAPEEPDECMCDRDNHYIEDSLNPGECVLAPDLIIRYIAGTTPSVDRSNDGGGSDILSIDFTIDNQGGVEASDSTLQVEDTDTTNPSDDGPNTGNTGIISAGGSYPGNTQLTYSDRLDTAIIKITADSTEILTESNNSNNDLTINVDCATPLGNNGEGQCDVSL